MKQNLVTFLFAAAMFVAASTSSTYAQECTEHQWEWHVVDEPTCDFVGMESRRCENCYEQETRAIPATGHQWGEWKTVEEATCSLPGYKIKKCSVCSISEREGIPATNEHQWGEWEIEDEPTCEFTGFKSRECTVCQYEDHEEIPVTEKHSWGEWETAKKSTALSDGKKVRYCEDCNKKETKLIPKLKASVSLKEKSATVEIGKSHTIKIKSKTYGDKIKKWTSSNKNIATITSGGKVQGKQEGNTIVTLQMESGVKATCKIQVIKSARSNTVPASGSGNNSSHSGSSGSNSSTGHVNPPASGYVWIPNTGSKYHRSGTCGRMKNPRQVPLQDAIHAGYEPCSRCS